MKKIITVLLLTLLLSACNGWVVQPLPLPTPFQPLTVTPSIFTATPIIIGVTSASATPVFATTTPSNTPFPTITFFTTDTPSYTPTTTIPNSLPSILVTVLGCNTSIDLTHGMGEVTNAFVTIKNTGNVALTNLRVTLLALDEGREHPDKTVELTSLPPAYQVTVKLTVDSTYKKDTPIQVEVASDQGTFPREGSAACRDIGILAPKPEGLNTPVPSNP